MRLVREQRFSKTNPPRPALEVMHDKASYGWSLGPLKAKVLLPKKMPRGQKKSAEGLVTFCINYVAFRLKSIGRAVKLKIHCVTHS